MGQWVIVFSEELTLSFFVRCWFRRRNVDFEVIRTAASGDESFVWTVVADSCSGDVVLRSSRTVELFAVGFVNCLSGSVYFVVYILCARVLSFTCISRV